MVRVAANETRNQQAGLLVADWLQQRLVDWVTAQEGDLLVDSEPKAAWLPAVVSRAWRGGILSTATAGLSRGDGIPAYRDVSCAATHPRSRGLGRYGYLPWPFGDAEHDLLREMAFPEVTARRDKRCSAAAGGGG